MKISVQLEKNGLGNVEIDGRRIDGVAQVKLFHTVGECPRVQLTFVPEALHLLVDGELEVNRTLLDGVLQKR